ncbi:ribonuclease P protein component [Luteimonas vadosa]|uniref:Ribonuclease P protein component n=1 Tax=Luteimonas vadosa TaxID=1165507 RepID=A0ABP9DRQ2_9GAMM
MTDSARGLPRQARVRARAEFDRVFAQGHRTASPWLALHWQRDVPPPRLGLAVSRKVDKRAVGRNRIKRVLRASFRMLRGQLRDGAYVVVARPAAAQQENHALAADLVALLRRAGALPATGADGTMPGDPPPHPSHPDPSGE